MASSGAGLAGARGTGLIIVRMPCGQSFDAMMSSDSSPIVADIRTRAGSVQPVSVTRRDQAYWQRLRRDKPSGLAALAAIGSSGVVLVEVIDIVLPGSQGMHRSTRLYWALLIPFAWWAINLVNYDRRVAGTLVPACIVAPIVAVGWVVVDKVLGASEVWLSWCVALTSLILGLSAMFFYRRSLLMVEGPAK